MIFRRFDLRLLSGEVSRQRNHPSENPAVKHGRTTGNVTAGGVATIQGAKNVTVDGRAQLVEVRGLVRAEDISSANTIPSSRIADAVITYKGKKIAPRSGILGKILSILWP